MAPHTHTHTYIRHFVSNVNLALTVWILLLHVERIANRYPVQ